jgi:hypothetical protein
MICPQQNILILFILLRVLSQGLPFCASNLGYELGFNIFMICFIVARGLSECTPAGTKFYLISPNHIPILDQTMSLLPFATRTDRFHDVLDSFSATLLGNACQDDDEPKD